MSVGGIIGIVLGAILVVVVVIAIISLIYKNRKARACVVKSSDKSTKGSNFDKGKRSENYATHILSRLKIDEKLVFQNLMFPLGKGYQEVDNILLTRRGVFLIECKNWSGTVKGNENDEMVEQIDVSGNYSHPRKNPIRQTSLKVRAIATYLKIDPNQIVPILAFGCEKILLESSKVNIVPLFKVGISIKNMYDKLPNFISETLYQRIAYDLTYLANNPPITSEQHIKDIQEKYGD